MGGEGRGGEGLALSIPTFYFMAPPMVDTISFTDATSFDMLLRILSCYFVLCILLVTQIHCTFLAKHNLSCVREIQIVAFGLFPKAVFYPNFIPDFLWLHGRSLIFSLFFSQRTFLQLPVFYCLCLQSFNNTGQI